MSKSYSLMSKTFTNTSAHISGKVVAKDEEELEKLKREIAKIEKLLSK
jgi:nitrate reductase NapAB chaperone NapD